MIGLNDRFRDVRMLDIPVELEIPIYDVKYFADDSHLSKEGQKAFTEEFKQNNNL